MDDPQPTVAVLGASSHRHKYGNKSVRAHLQQGYEVYPVNPKGGEIEGLTVYRTLAEVPVEQLDRISVYLPPAVGLATIEAIYAAYRVLGRDTTGLLDGYHWAEPFLELNPELG